MASVNKVILVGNLGKDPESRFLPDGGAVCNFSVATTDKWKDKSGEQQERTEWHRISTFSKLAEICGEYLGAVRARQHVISFNKVVSAEHEPARRRQKLRVKDFYRVLAPYVSVRFIEQVKCVVPLALFLAVFDALVLNSSIEGARSA